MTKLWSSRHLLDKLLELRCAKADLRRMSRLAKIKTVYQCTLEAEHEDTSLLVAGRNATLALLDKKLPTRKIPAEFGLSIRFLKAIFKIDTFYCMPE